VAPPPPGGGGGGGRGGVGLNVNAPKVCTA
jgi:hypothetical protein